MKISYYDLLKLVKEGNEPKRIKVSIVSGKSVIYTSQYDYNNLNYYEIENDSLEDDNYSFYLSECFLESTMFDECIEIIEPKGIEKCKSYEEFLSIDEYIEHLKIKINELIEVVSNLDK